MAPINSRSPSQSRRLNRSTIKDLAVAPPQATPVGRNAEGFERFVGGQCLFRPRGEAWRTLTAWIVDLPLEGQTLALPAVAAPFLAWTMSCEVAFQSFEAGWLAVTVKL